RSQSLKIAFFHKKFLLESTSTCRPSQVRLSVQAFGSRYPGNTIAIAVNREHTLTPFTAHQTSIKSSDFTHDPTLQQAIFAV
ncbi:MAG: hypothetical protein LWW75_04555, partial [Chlorobiales bacterium]|nr:hypothetical protein [Chlorobiales bacterium]